MSNAGGWFAVICILLGFYMTFHSHLTGRIVGAILVIGPVVLAVSA